MDSRNRPDAGKKSVLLRLNAELWNEISAWSEEEFRSINGQIEYLLTEAVRQRKKSRDQKDRRQDSTTID